MPKFSGILLASDLDGTLLDHEGSLSRENRDALLYFMQNGGLFTAATGRGRQSFEKVRGIIPKNAPVILSNGGLVIDFGKTGCEENVIFRDFLSDECYTYLDMVISRFPDIGIESYAVEGISSYNPNEYAWWHFNYVGVADQVSVVESLSDMPRPFNKVIFTQENERLKAFAEVFSREIGDRFELVFSAPFLFEMQSKGISKASGILKIAEALGISRDRIFAAGDQENDLSMIKAFHSFSPEDGQDIVKKEATHIVSPCDRHSISHAIRIIEDEYC